MKKFIKINLIVLIMIITPFSCCVATNIIAENAVIDASNTSNQTTSPEPTKLDELQKEKTELENNIQESNNQIGIVESELSDILIYLEQVTLEISEKNQEIDKLTLENEKLKIYINNVQADLSDITADYTKKKATLDKRLVASYQMGKTSYLDLLLKSKGLISFISNYYLISEMLESDKKLLNECSDAKKYMQELETSLLEKQETLEDNKEKIDNNKNYLENMEKIKEKQVEELSETEAELYAKINEYQTEIENVEKEIRALNIANVGSEYIGGKMAWPVPGYTRITSPFGMRTHPITGIYKLHTGTDIGAPYGANFIAANDGIVIKAEMNRAYGNMVIIDHGGGINTLYAHGSEILVQEGDYVTQGTPVLKVGSTGYSTGPHAHFEVRVNGEYQNPLDYITSYNNTETKEEKNEEKKETEEVVINN